MYMCMNRYMCTHTDGYRDGKREKGINHKKINIWSFYPEADLQSSLCLILKTAKAILKRNRIKSSFSHALIWEEINYRVEEKIEKEDSRGVGFLFWFVLKWEEGKSPSHWWKWRAVQNSAATEGKEKLWYTFLLDMLCYWNAKATATICESH